MKLLVFGKTGQVARELQALTDVIAWGREDADLSDAATCPLQFEKTHLPLVSTLLPTLP